MKHSLLSILLTGLLSTLLGAEELLQQGSFEWPLVVARKAKSEGGDVTQAPVPTEWIKITDQTEGEGGRIVLGLSNEVFRSGRQAMYVHFDKVTKPDLVAELVSDMIPVQPGKPYRIAIWGRVDRKFPLTKDQRLPYLKLRVDWFTAGKDEQTADTEWKVQPMPGSKNRPALFAADRWSEYFAKFEAPADAAYVKFAWSWETPPQEGETNGIIYFDDATLEGEPGVKEVEPGDEEMKEDAAAEAADGTVVPAPTTDAAVVPLSEPPAKAPVSQPEVKKP